MMDWLLLSIQTNNIIRVAHMTFYRLNCKETSKYLFGKIKYIEPVLHRSCDMGKKLVTNLITPLRSIIIFLNTSLTKQNFYIS